MWESIQFKETKSTEDLLEFSLGLDFNSFLPQRLLPPASLKSLHRWILSTLYFLSRQHFTSVTKSSLVLIFIC